jgi:CBS domain-containing protein
MLKRHKSGAAFMSTSATVSRAEEFDRTHLRMNDAAVGVVRKSTDEALWTISEDRSLAEVLRSMSRLGVKAFLVTRATQIIGLITLEDIKRERGTHGPAARVGDVMTDAAHVPMIDWQSVLHSTVDDLLSIFENTHSNHLMVVQLENAAHTRVRGVVYRRQLIGKLGVRAILDRGMESALTNTGTIPP